MRKYLASLLLLVASLALGGNNAQYVNSGGSLSTTAKTLHAVAVAGGFTPDVLFTFNDGPNNHGLTLSGTHVGVDNTLSAVRGGASVQSSLGATGYGGKYSTTQTRGGRTYSASLSISSGSDGDPSDNGDGKPLIGAGGDGLFGLNFYGLPAGVRGVSGGYTHVRFWIYIPSGVNWTSNAGWLKMIRYHRGGAYGHVETHISNTGAQATNIPNGSQATQEGWTFKNESDSASEAYTGSPINGYTTVFVTNRKFVPGQWNCFERRDDWNSTGSLAKRTIWVNGLFVAKFSGSSIQWIDGSGVLQTYNSVTPSATIDAGVMDEMRLFTYWNGYAPQNTEFFVDEVVFHGGTLPSTDAYGNPFIGTVTAQ